MNQTRRAHLALLCTTIIFGMAYNIVKSLMPDVLSPMQLIFIRLLGGLIIFWLFQRLFVPEKVKKKDLLMLAVCGIFGFALNQSLFYEGLNLSTPVDASLIHVLNPVFVIIFASLILGEKVTREKAVGILLGASGVIILVLNGRSFTFNADHVLGNILILLNMIFYALYLVLIKPLIGKYHTTTILKWVSFFGFLFILPFSIKPTLDINFREISLLSWLGISYIIILNTFVAYLLINFALKTVTATVVSYYSYLQPLIATLFSLTLGQGGITWAKALAALLIFLGVYLVNSNKNKTRVSQDQKR